MPSDKMFQRLENMVSSNRFSAEILKISGCSSMLYTYFSVVIFAKDMGVASCLF